MRSTIRDRADRAFAAFFSARREVLASIAEVDRTEAWRGDGAANLEAWVCARYQVSPKTARELVLQARALAEMPDLDEAYSKGQVSCDQMKAVATLSEPGNDGAWVESLWGWSISELEREARKKKARQAERDDGGVYLKVEPTPCERFMSIKGQLHPEDGAAVLSALDSLVPKGTAYRDYDSAHARALVELCTQAKAPRATVMLSVSDAVLGAGEDEEAVAALGHGRSESFVRKETARRLCCDASVRLLYKDENGKITAVGKMSRTVPPHMRQAVYDRDGGKCTFPGCGRDRYLECHHIIAVEDGGPTVLGNLLLTCWTHHVMLHEGGWSVEGEPGPRITWVRPDGTPFEPRVRVTLDTS